MADMDPRYLEPDTLRKLADMRTFDRPKTWFTGIEADRVLAAYYDWITRTNAQVVGGIAPVFLTPTLNLPYMPTYAWLLSSPTIDEVQTPMPCAGIFDGLYVRLSADMNATASVTFLVNGVGTVLRVGLGAAGVYSDLVHSVSVAAGDLVCVVMDDSVPAPSLPATISLRFRPS